MLENLYNITEDNFIELDDWRSLHFKDLDVIPEDMRDGTVKMIPINPSPEAASNIIALGPWERMKHLPEPTWALKLNYGDSILYCYCLSVSYPTGESKRTYKNRSGEVQREGVGRSASHNKAIKIEWNIKQVTKSVDTYTTMLHPINFLSRDEGEFLWSGQQFTLNQLESGVRKSLADLKLAWDSLPTAFLSEGGSARTPAQEQARMENLRKANSSSSAKALVRARTALAIEATGDTEALIKFLDIDPRSLNKQLARSRELVARAEEVESSEGEES